MLSAQNKFYIVLSSYVKELVKKNSSVNFMVGFQASKIWLFYLENLLVEQVLNHFQAELIP